MLRDECRVLVWRGDVIRSARSTSEHHDVAPGAVAIEVQDDVRPLDDVVETVCIDHVVDQDGFVFLKQVSDRIRLRGCRPC